MAVVAALSLAGCSGQHEPRSFQDFMDDAIARDGVLARCNQDREESLDDVECSNARRAAEAAAVALERARSAELALESERKLLALRERVAIQQEAELRAVAEAQAAAEAAYDAQWIDPSARQQPLGADVVASLDADAAAAARAFGPPIGAPVLSENSAVYDFAVYAKYDGQLPMRPSLELAAVTPPVSDLQINRPQLDLDEAVIPRPFRDSATRSPVPQ